MLTAKEFEQFRTIIVSMQSNYVSGAAGSTPTMVAGPMVPANKIVEILSKFVKYEPNKEAREFQDELMKA